MNAIITCVDFDDYLKVTLPRNVAHFAKVLVVTSLKDRKTERVALSFKNVLSLATDAFYDEGAKFNKGRALEQGFDVLGRDGWIMVLDADVILPDRLDPGMAGWLRDSIYSPYRRLCESEEQLRQLTAWAQLPYGPEHDRLPDEFAGYCQIFHASAPWLRSRKGRPENWYPLDCPTARGCDSEFYRRWPRECRRRPAFEVLHLGPTRVNWAGRRTPRWSKISTR